MQQRQLRLGDILDDYCPRERRLTNHVVVAMIGDDVKQTRCTTCDAEHEYKHARVPRQRRKAEPAALYAQVLAGATPKKVVHERPRRTGQTLPTNRGPALPLPALAARRLSRPRALARQPTLDRLTPSRSPATAIGARLDDGAGDEPTSEPRKGPVHRPLIRAQLPRIEGQPPPARPAPDFTIRQPGGPAEPVPSAPAARRWPVVSGEPFERQHADTATRAAVRRGSTADGRRLMSHLAKRQGRRGRKRSK